MKEQNKPMDDDDTLPAKRTNLYSCRMSQRNNPALGHELIPKTPAERAASLSAYAALPKRQVTAEEQELARQQSGCLKATLIAGSAK